MEPFCWLHISDLHLRANIDTWGQNVVLRDTVRDIKTQLAHFPTIEFIVVSGDLAFSGRAEEYELVAAFLDDLRGVVGLERSRVFLVPGNHDINRTIQTTCYYGAKQLLTSPQMVEQFLGTELERQTLLQRLEAYFNFERRYCEHLLRTITDDGLGFVAPLNLSGMPLCIVGLNSAWMCQGGDEDERQILVGDRLIINLVEMIRELSPRLVVGVMHHPPDWLRHFDQQALEERLLPACDFLLRGHLHEPNVHLASHISGHHCIAIAAGAGYAGRQFQNSYSIIRIDLADACCTVSHFLYETQSGRYRGE
jgi:predicted MPP superfamily phosphohydrolase